MALLLLDAAVTWTDRVSKWFDSPPKLLGWLAGVLGPYVFINYVWKPLEDRIRKKRPGEHPLRPTVEWIQGEIACTFHASELAKGFTVSDTTELVVVDNDRVQFTCHPGEITPAKWNDLSFEKNLTKRARAIQYLVRPVTLPAEVKGCRTLEDYPDVRCTVTTKVQCDRAAMVRMLESEINKDLYIREDSLRSAMEQALELPLKDALLKARFPSPEKSVRVTELQAGLQDKCSQGVLLIGIEGLVCQSEQWQASEAGRLEAGRKAREAAALLEKQRAEELARQAQEMARIEKERAGERLRQTKAELQAAISEALRREKILEAERDHVAEQAEKRLEHEAELAEWDRLKEISEKVQWVFAGLQASRQKEGEQLEGVAKKMEQEPVRTDDEAARQSILKELDGLRRGSQPFTLHLARAKPGTRDIGVRYSSEVARIGEQLQFEVLSARSGYLSIFNVGTSGAVTQLYPNQYHPDCRIEANQWIQIPGSGDNFELPVLGPPGREIVQAFVTSHPIDAPVPRGSQFAAWDVQTGTRNIGVTAKRLREEPADSWAEATIIIEVPPAQAAGGEIF